ncbi:hypothetical protein [Noviherbaspirillum autotrophicum]|uniref:hypothetical protein n=1 Tax=Noviherbaspirillum autotrophicum TaxID=709839 RepID=UPI0012FE45C5|nr:hypothetical protein [Noviherbaspirillum autotrophicum]
MTLLLNNACRRWMSAPKAMVQILCLFDAVSKAGIAGITDVNVPMTFENNTGRGRKDVQRQSRMVLKLMSRQEFARCEKVFDIF